MRRLTQICVRYAEEYIPDPFLYAALMTFIAASAALIWTPSSISEVAVAWYNGLWSLLGFAMQIALVLLTGLALADAPPVKKLLQKIASIPQRQSTAAVMIFLLSLVGSWLHFAFGLVIGALCAREIAKRLRDVDFGFIVAAAYAGFMICPAGISSSIVLAAATPAHPMNFIDKYYGRISGFHETIFAPYMLIPLFAFALLYPVVLIMAAPAVKDMRRIDPQSFADEGEEKAPASPKKTFATVLESSPIVTGILVLMGLIYAVHAFTSGEFVLDFNAFTFIALMLGLIFHLRPIAYVRSFKRGAANVGPILLQYPLYGGIMTIMTATGLADVIARSFVAFSSQATLPFWSFISSNLITLFIPSGGAHWAVQGPFMIPAALALHADPVMTMMGVAIGEGTGNMVQPFWALPLLALARLGIKDIMGYCVIAMMLGLVLFGGSFLVFGYLGTTPVR